MASILRIDGRFAPCVLLQCGANDVQILRACAFASIIQLYERPFLRMASILRIDGRFAPCVLLQCGANDVQILRACAFASIIPYYHVFETCNSASACPIRHFFVSSHFFSKNTCQTSQTMLLLLSNRAEVMELVDVMDSKSIVLTLRAGSSPAFGTNTFTQYFGTAFFIKKPAPCSHERGHFYGKAKSVASINVLVHVPLGRSGRIFRHRRQNLVPPPLRLSARLSPKGSRLVHSARQDANRLRPALAKNAAPWRFLNASRPPSAPHPNKTNRTARFVLFYMKDCFGIGFTRNF